MRVVVTGASNATGRRVVDFLLKRGHKVTTVGNVDPKIAKTTHAKWGVPQKKAHVIVHCDEARSDNEDLISDDETKQFYADNIGLVRAAMSLNTKARFVLLSSIDVHRYKDNFDAHEKSLEDNIIPLSVYGMSKALVEREVENQKGTDAYILRPSELYGFEESNFSRIVDSLGSGRVILPSKNVKTKLLHIENLCEVIDYIVQNYEAPFGYYNVADHEELDLHETIVKMAKSNGREMKIMHLPYPIALKAAESFERKAKKKEVTPQSTIREVNFLGRDSSVSTERVEALIGRGLPSRLL